MNRIKKLIISLIFISLIWILQFIEPIAFGIEKTIIYPIAECIVNNHTVIFLSLLITGIIGITFKNKYAYYRVFVNITIVLCYLILLSMIITQNFHFGTKYLPIRLILFSASFIITYMFIDELKEDTGNEKRNKLSPIAKYEDLYESRHHQATKLIDIIKSKESDCGYSICISGEWGSGKTSFINCVLNKLAYENNKKCDLSIAEIRINAMELDSLSSLVNYLFERIKNILKENNIYVGLNSEYQDLVSSLMGIVTTDSTANFIKNKLFPKSDYRENLSNLNQLILTHLKNKKILIVVDDLERCTKEKSLEFLLFIKEIAMLNRCVVIFLTDYDKLKNQTELDNDFLEKFFNYKMNLQSVTVNEIIKKTITDDTFLTLIYSSETMFLNRIKEAESDLYAYIGDSTNKKHYKEERVNEERFNYKLFTEKVQNSRQLIKVYQKYIELLNTVESFKKISNDDYINFIDKVNYRKQIFIISMVYGFDSNKYAILESNGISSYFSCLNSVNKKDQNYEKNIIDILAYEEWYNNLFNDYITQEKWRFTSCLLDCPNDLPKIANGFTSLQEKYISSIQNNIKPTNISLTDILKETINAKFTSDLEREQYLLQVINLYKKGVNLDEVISILSDKQLIHLVKDDNFIVKIFYNVFKNSEVINKQQCLEKFISFSQHYMYSKLKNITIYVSLLCNEDSYHNNIEDIVFNFSNCSSMISEYFNKITNAFQLNLSSCSSPIECLNLLLKQTNSYCNINDISYLNDIKMLSNKASKSIECIDYLLKFEQCLNNNENIQYRETINGDNFSEKLQDAINLINHSNEDKIYKLLPKIYLLFSEIVNLDIELETDDLEKMNNIILLCSDKLGESYVPLRKKYIEIKNKLQINNTL